MSKEFRKRCVRHRDVPTDYSNGQWQPSDKLRDLVSGGQIFTIGGALIQIIEKQRRAILIIEALQRYLVKYPGELLDVWALRCDNNGALPCRISWNKRLDISRSLNVVKYQEPRFIYSKYVNYEIR